VLVVSDPEINSWRYITGQPVSSPVSSVLWSCRLSNDQALRSISRTLPATSTFQLVELSIEEMSVDVVNWCEARIPPEFLGGASQNAEAQRGPGPASVFGPGKGMVGRVEVMVEVSRGAVAVMRVNLRHFGRGC